MIEILSTNALTSVQDVGRFGFYHYGVGTSGAMDRVALSVGNLLLGNEPDAAGLEVSIMPFRMRFLRNIDFALTGADTNARLDDRVLLPYWALGARSGQTLILDPPQRGCRAYITFGGGLDLPVVLGSRSTHLRAAFGGFDGRALQPGDRIPCGLGGTRLGIGGLGAEPPEIALREPRSDKGTTTVRVLPAGEYGEFDVASREAFWETDWKISRQSNRAGYRLAGPALNLSQARELRSHGVLPGVIQAPSGGTPIVQLADAATMGGYPKIGTVIEADLWRIAQARLGTALRFLPTTYAAACAALAEVDAYLQGVRIGASQCR